MTQREIKFRAFDKQQGGYRYEPMMIDYRQELIVFGSEPTASWPLSRFTVEQYIGMKDKNGKEIYDGDILSDGEHKSPVIFSKYGGEYLALVDNGAKKEIERDVWNLLGGETEIIGNINKND